MSALPSTAPRMPAIFVGHGSPMNALDDNDYTRFLHRWGQSLPRPRAILVVSAHWMTSGAIAFGAQPAPRTIHDFGGFPPALYALSYPAPGAPALAQAAADLIRSYPAELRSDWGLDHGAWTVLRHMYPAADIPVWQVSLVDGLDGAAHYQFGRELAALREQGVLILGSGNIVHNLRALDFGTPDAAHASRAWAADFDAAVAAALKTRDDAALCDYLQLNGAALAAPTPEHFLPLLVVLGAAAANEAASTVFQQFQLGTLGMRSVQFD